MARVLECAEAYWDESGDQPGWAYRLFFEGGHEESGALDSGDPNDSDGIVGWELELLITANGGRVSSITEDRDGRLRWKA